MNKKRTACLVNIFSLTILFGCASAPRITVDYSSLGQTQLDSELMSHWQTGSEVLTRDIQALVDSNIDQGGEVQVEKLEEMGAHCSPSYQNVCAYTGVIRYRLFGLPDPSKDGRLTT